MAKEAFKDGYLTFDGSTYGVTDLSYTETYSQIDGTDTKTTGDGKEYYAGRAERTMSVTILKDPTTDDLSLNSASSASLDFEGFQYTGSLKLLSKTCNGTVDNMVEMTYDGQFSGSVTESTSS